MARILTVAVLTACALAGWAGDAAVAASRCGDGNMLGLGQIVRSYGVIREQRLVDGQSPGVGTDINDYNAALFVERGAAVVFDLGEPRKVTAVDVVTDERDYPLLDWSVDGVSYQPVPLPHARQLRAYIWQRWDAGLSLDVRYLRLRPPVDTRFKAVAEVRLFCRTPANFPDSPALQRVDPYQAELRSLQNDIDALKYVNFALSLAGIAALAWMRRLGRRQRNAVALLVVIVGSLAWVRFGIFAVNGELLHPHDAAHYYLGSKYFDELRYRELYRCISKSEIEHGRGLLVDQAFVRDLDDYTLYRGKWTRLAQGGCRADFTPERWRAFAHDVDMFRWLFVRTHFHGIMKDHGYNATPLQTAWLAAATNVLPASHATLKGFAAVDIAMFVAAIAVMWWGFGPAAAAVAALTLGLSDIASYGWIGGSLGRSAWLLALCAGTAFLGRRCFAAGSALTTLAGLLRLVPFAFVAALGLCVFAGMTKARRVARSEWRILAGILLALGAGLVVPLIAFGPQIYAEFVSNTLLHAGNLGENRVGLGRVLQAVGSPAWLDIAVRGAAVLLCALSIAYLGVRDRPVWSVVPLGGLLIFSALQLGYDYAWLAVLAPLAALSLPASALLVGFVGLTNLTRLLLPVDVNYIVQSAVLIPVLPAIAGLGHSALGRILASRPERPGAQFVAGADDER